MYLPDLNWILIACFQDDISVGPAEIRGMAILSVHQLQFILF